jgi:3-ketosteroid 9alpha-monooxygenase subunit B
MTPGSPDHDAVLRDHGYHPLRVKGIVQETVDTRSYVLDIPDALRTTFGYRPGQFCTFRVRIGGAEHLRSYSMSSAPGIDPELTVTVKRMPGGLVSNWFHDQVAEGDVVEVTRPAGVFCPQETDRPMVTFCGGSGITPVISIVKSVLSTTKRSVRVLYANRGPESVIFQSLLGDLAARASGRLESRLHFDADSGYLEAGSVSAFAGATSTADFYICGPGPFMDLIESVLLDLGTDRERIFIERFVVDADAAPAAQLGREEGDAIPEGVTLILGGKKTSVPYQPGATILETARRGGLRPPFSCEAGNCATCMAMLREGTVRMRANNALTPEEVAEGWILTCQSLPTAPVVTVEYEAM